MASAHYDGQCTADIRRQVHLIDLCFLSLLDFFLLLYLAQKSECGEDSRTQTHFLLICMMGQSRHCPKRHFMIRNMGKKVILWGRYYPAQTHVWMWRKIRGRWPPSHRRRKVDPLLMCFASVLHATHQQSVTEASSTDAEWSLSVVELCGASSASRAPASPCTDPSSFEVRSGSTPTSSGCWRWRVSSLAVCSIELDAPAAGTCCACRAASLTNGDCRRTGLAGRPHCGNRSAVWKKRPSLTRLTSDVVLPGRLRCCCVPAAAAASSSEGTSGVASSTVRWADVAFMSLMFGSVCIRSRRDRRASIVVDSFPV